jgi:hypothetical protein
MRNNRQARQERQGHSVGIHIVTGNSSFPLASLAHLAVQYADLCSPPGKALHARRRTLRGLCVLRG